MVARKDDVVSFDRLERGKVYAEVGGDEVEGFVCVGKDGGVRDYLGRVKGPGRYYELMTRSKASEVVDKLRGGADKENAVADFLYELFETHSGQ